MMKPSAECVMKDVMRALEEDLGTGDVTASLLSEKTIVMAEIQSREPMLMCGQAWVEASFLAVDSAVRIDWSVEEGAWLDRPTTLCQITGLARSILTSERTALNFLQTLSATATQTRVYLQALQGYKTRLLDTRKTLPGLRLAQKYAVACAGGVNHRFGLYDAFLIKENHIAACGSIREAIRRARLASQSMFVEVEVQTLAEFQEALVAKPDRILLDNFSIAQLREAVLMNASRCPLEASGGVDETTIANVAETGVDYISVGAITKSIRAIDLSLLVIRSLDKRT